MPPKNWKPDLNSEERKLFMEFIKKMERDLDRAERELDNIEKTFQVLISPRARITVCLN